MPSGRVVLGEQAIVSKKGGILLANLFQGSRSTLSCIKFPSVFAFQAGMWGTLISALLNSPTVIHEPGLSTADEISSAIFRRVSGGFSRLYPAQIDLPVATVKKNPLK
jgi:hypothetical protein